MIGRPIVIVHVHPVVPVKQFPYCMSGPQMHSQVGVAVHCDVRGTQLSLGPGP
jgi:hypothetical protein